MSIIASNNPFPHDPDDNWGTKLDKGGYSGTAQDLFNLIDEISSPDDILVKGKVTKTLNVLSIEAGSFTCRIDQVVITNAGSYSTIIDEAADGYYRIDILVFTKFGTILKIKGPEDIGSAQEPETPEGTLKISFISVFGNVIGNPELPIESGFITKASKSVIKMASAGIVDIYPVDDRSFLSFDEGMLSLKSLNISDSNNLYLGKSYIIRNGTTGSVTLFHNQGSGNFKFNFPNSLDFVLKPGECISMVLRITNYGTYTGFLDYIGTIVDLTGKADLVSGKVPWYQLPSYVDDILEGYLMSNVFYAESSYTNIIPGEAGKVYVDVTTGQKNKQYRYSGSLYVQITNGLIASTDDVPEGSANKYSTAGLVMSYILSGLSFASGSAITAGDTILSALGKLQKQITDLISTVAGKQVLDNQIEINSNGNVQNAWHGQTVLFTASCTITVPASLNNSLMFPFRTLAGVTVTWAITSPFVWETTPSLIYEKTTGHFMRRGSTNTIILDS
ncbi:hypothetical protein GJU43_14920 [Flavobacterium sp. LC2016-23]|uniref:hypothetical protein n=1 Tax=Flavobacterium sp. LC2016-23 TaxID=2666330 RepID=UPI0012B0F2BC|nr:hypothetical protein [Flavobacterium sp. LC2016-23]MRX40579.1 hypothetical protein [Flavobacterium sp. LC2016-23]